MLFPGFLHKRYEAFLKIEQPLPAYKLTTTAAATFIVYKPPLSFGCRSLCRIDRSREASSDRAAPQLDHACPATDGAAPQPRRTLPEWKSALQDRHTWPRRCRKVRYVLILAPGHNNFVYTKTPLFGVQNRAKNNEKSSA